MDDQSVAAKGDELLVDAMAAAAMQASDAAMSGLSMSVADDPPGVLAGLKAKDAPGSEVSLSFDYKRGEIRLDFDGHRALMTPDVARQLAHELRKAANHLERAGIGPASAPRRQPLRGGRGRRGRL